MIALQPFNMLTPENAYPQFRSVHNALNLKGCQNPNAYLFDYKLKEEIAKQQHHLISFINISQCLKAKIG